MTPIPDEWKYDREGFEDYRAFLPADTSKIPPSQLERKEVFTRLMMSKRDFSDAQISINFMHETMRAADELSFIELQRLRCYETAFVVAYARPFTQSRGSQIPHLSFGHLGVKLSSFTQQLHDSIIRERNTFYAHSDEAAVEFRDSVMQGVNKEGKPYSYIRPPRFDVGIQMTRDEVLLAGVLTQTMMTAVAAVLQAMHARLDHGLPIFDKGEYAPTRLNE